jgi:hypothetical protein
MIGRLAIAVLALAAGIAAASLVPGVSRAVRTAVQYISAPGAARLQERDRTVGSERTEQGSVTVEEKPAIVTLTATDTTEGVGGPGGFLKIYSAALGTPPSTSSINWTGAGQNIAVTTQVAVDASGQIKVTDGSNSTNFVVDVIGYLF